VSGATYHNYMCWIYVLGEDQETEEEIQLAVWMEGWYESIRRIAMAWSRRCPLVVKRITQSMCQTTARAVLVRLKAKGLESEG
jgi:hypothetical protein